MTKPVVFKLTNESINKELGTITFNGNFVFKLNENITPDVWNNIGFIPLKHDKKQVVSNDLFYYLNARLPLDLRKGTTKKKIDYIKEQGLKVASDSFSLHLI